MEEKQEKAVQPPQARFRGGWTNTYKLGGPRGLSDIYHSNEQYFRKLQELKTSHKEIMAKLEKMHQNKLNLKEVQPVILREEASNVWSLYQKRTIVLSHESPGSQNLMQVILSSSLIVSFSEDELPT